MTKGPGQGELRVRLALVALGFVLILIAVVARGMDGAATVEVLAIAGLFFGGSALFILRRMSRREDE